MKEKTFFSNRIRPKKHSPEIQKIYDHFITPISSLLVDGVDFCIFRAYKVFPHSEEWSYDIVYEWSWAWTSCHNTGYLSETISDCTYDEVDEYGEGYYLATVMTDSEHIEEDDGVWRTQYFSAPDKFILFVPINEIETTETDDAFLNMDL